MIDPNNERHQLWMHGYYAGRIDERKQQERAGWRLHVRRLFRAFRTAR